MKYKLNGWQRLWIVLTVLWVVLVLCVSLNIKPMSSLVIKEDNKKFISKLHKSNTYIDSTEKLTAFKKEIKLMRIEGATNWEKLPIAERKEGFTYVITGDKDTPLYIEEYKPNYDRILHSIVKEIDGRYSAYLPELGNEVLNARSFVNSLYAYYSELEKNYKQTVLWPYYLKSIMAGLIPSIIIYMLGFSVSWIRKGFRSND